MSEQDYSDPGALAAARAGTQAITSLVDPTGELHEQLLAFLTTSYGLSWLSKQMNEWKKPVSLQDLNQFILLKFKEFLSSDTGRKVSKQLHQEMTSGLLVVPVYVVEELVKRRLRAFVQVHLKKNKMFYLKFFSWRVLLATTLLHAGRAAALKVADKLGPRWTKATKFVTDVLLAPATYGPALGVMVGLVQLANRDSKEDLDVAATGDLEIASSARVQHL